MPEQTVKLTNDVGLHARPAAVFSKASAEFTCDVKVEKDGNDANDKSIMSVLKLDVKGGDTVTLRTSGENEDVALTELVKVVESL